MSLIRNLSSFHAGRMVAQFSKVQSHFTHHSSNSGVTCFRQVSTGKLPMIADPAPTVSSRTLSSSQSFPNPPDHDGQRRDDGDGARPTERLRTSMQTHGFLMLPLHLALTVIWFVPVYLLFRCCFRTMFYVVTLGGSVDTLAKLLAVVATVVVLKLATPLRYLTTLAVSGPALRALERRRRAWSSGRGGEQKAEKTEQGQERSKKDVD